MKVGARSSLRRASGAIPFSVFALILFGALTCSHEFESGHGFTMRLPSEVVAETAHSKSEGRYVDVRHRTQPKCLFGRIESFVPLDPREYFRRLNEETDLTRRRPFLQEDARPRTYGSVLAAPVLAFDEGEGRHLPAVVGAFLVREQLWIAWLYQRCDVEAQRRTALSLLESIDVRAERDLNAR